MDYAQVVIIEANDKEVEIPLEKMHTIKELYDIFFELTGRRHVVSISAGVARVNCNRPEIRKGDFCAPK